MASRCSGNGNSRCYGPKGAVTYVAFLKRTRSETNLLNVQSRVGVVALFDAVFSLIFRR